MSTVSDPLKYLFIANFEDGHEIVQPPDDRSQRYVEGADHNPSAFTDVLDYLSQSPLLRFSLFNVATRREAVSLELKTGYFEIFPSPKRFKINGNQSPHKPDIIFHRITQMKRTITPIIEDGKVVGSTTQDFPPEIVAYALGWKDNGNSNEHVLVLE